MAFCPNCGTQASGRYCPNCGTDLSAATGRTSGTAPGSGYVPPRGATPNLQAPGLTENVASALCYLFWIITGIVFLVIGPYNKNRTIRFHAFQSIFASIAIFAIHIIIDFAFLSTPYMWNVGFTIRRIFNLAVLVLWLYMMYSAYNNRKIKLPVIGDLAEKQA